MGRRAVGRRALMRTLRDIFSYRNPLRQFMDAYRFNVIRWSASNLREPTLGKRVRLFLGTRNPLRILRDNFRQNRADLTADWERAVIGRINLSLEELGSIPLHSRSRDLAKRLDRVGRMINRMTGYEHCPSLLTERLLLSTYRYIFMAPHDRRFGALCPDGICGHAAAERRAAGEPVLPELRKPAARKGDGHLRVHLQRERATISASLGTREAGCRPGRV